MYGEAYEQGLIDYLDIEGTDKATVRAAIEHELLATVLAAPAGWGDEAWCGVRGWL